MFCQARPPLTPVPFFAFPPVVSVACAFPHLGRASLHIFPQGPAVLVSMVFVVLCLAFMNEVMETFDRMLTATDDLWFEVAVDRDRDGKISAKELSALSFEEAAMAQTILNKNKKWASTQLEPRADGDDVDVENGN